MLRLDRYVARVLEAMDYRADADETAVFARQLENVRSRTYEVEYPDLKARKLFPMASGVSPDDRTFTYRQFDYAGEAKIVHPSADDFPTVEISGSEKTHKILSMGVAYDYSIQDLRYARRAGLDLDGRKARAARDVMERKLESLCQHGDEDNGIATGFLNAPNILEASPSTKAVTTDSSTSWFTAAGIFKAKGYEVKADIDRMALKIHDTTLGRRHGNTLLLDTKSYGALATTPAVVLMGSDTVTLQKSILQYLLESSPWLTSIEHWVQCDAGDPDTDLARIALYDRSEDVVELVVPGDFEQLPPQAKNLKFHVPCHMRVAGVVVNLPKAVCFMDGIYTT